MVPVISYDLIHPWNNTISNKSLCSPLPDGDIVGLPEVEECFVEVLLSHCLQLLQYLGFEVGSPHSLNRLKAMEYIMKLYHRPDPPIDDPQQYLPYYLHNINPFELPYSLRD